ncbi:MAG: hypothetical protein WCJ84_02625 [Candidatus Peregrinibacteria bacterium]
MKNQICFNTSKVIVAQIIGLLNPYETTDEEKDPVTRYKTVQVAVFGSTGLPEKLQYINIPCINPALYEDVVECFKESQEVRLLVDIDIFPENFGQKKKFYEATIVGLAKETSPLL